METTAEEFVTGLSQTHDVIVIGGLAVIAHGLSRTTMDADIWLHPMESAVAWADAVEDICRKFDGLTIHTLPGWREIKGSEVEKRRGIESFEPVRGLENLPIRAIEPEPGSPRPGNHLPPRVRRRRRPVLASSP